jgi:hypothetical protein
MLDDEFPGEDPNFFVLMREIYGSARRIARGSDKAVREIIELLN